MPEPDLPEQLPVINEKTLSTADVVAHIKARERRYRRWVLLFTILPTTAGLFLLGYVYVTRNVPELPMNARLTVQAWTAFNAGRWEEAIARADECTSRFSQAAEATQTKLAQQSVPPPPVGPVPDDLRRTIASRGPLNDVATCWFMRGRASETLGRTSVAVQAYQTALRFPHARCWDPNGWFWSPAEAAQERLKHLSP